MAAVEKFTEAQAVRKAAQEALGVGADTGPKPSREQYREALEAASAPSPPAIDADLPDRDVFGPGIASVLEDPMQFAKSRFAPHSRDRLQARRELQQQRAKAAPARRVSGPKPGQAASWAQWEEHTREKLRAMTSEARAGVVFSEWYDGLSERGQDFVDGVSLELEYGPLMVDDTERP